MLGALRQADQDEERQGRAHAPVPCGGCRPGARGTARRDDHGRGVRVEVRWQGRRRPLPADIDLAAFRIVQESVTNAVRHSGADSCQVRLDYRADELAVEVSDRGKGGGTSTETGYGLIGMRERAALLHGDFTAGPRPGAASW
ncbi:sensor histidine kinase [Streptomyces stramineus]